MEELAKQRGWIGSGLKAGRHLWELKQLFQANMASA